MNLFIIKASPCLNRQIFAKVLMGRLIGIGIENRKNRRFLRNRNRHRNQKIFHENCDS